MLTIEPCLPFYPSPEVPQHLLNERQDLPPPPRTAEHLHTDGVGQWIQQPLRRSLLGTQTPLGEEPSGRLLEELTQPLSVLEGAVLFAFGFPQRSVRSVSTRTIVAVCRCFLLTFAVAQSVTMESGSVSSTRSVSRSVSIESHVLRVFFALLTLLTRLTMLFGYPAQRFHAVAAASLAGLQVLDTLAPQGRGEAREAACQDV